MQDIKQCLDSVVIFTAAQLDSVLRSLLNKYAPVNVKERLAAWTYVGYWN